MHTLQIKPYTFIYNPDFSGVVTIINSSGTEFKISGGHLKTFIGEVLKERAISRLENRPADDFLNPSSR